MNNTILNNKGYAYFTPIDVLDEHMPVDLYAKLRAPVLSSMVWMLNTQCINTATNVMFDLYREREEDMRNVALPEYIGTIVNLLDREEVYFGTKDENRECSIEGNENTLRLLLSLRPAMYKLATEAMTAADYKDASIDSFLEKERFSVRLLKSEPTDVSAEERALIMFDNKLLTSDPKELAYLIEEDIKTREAAKKQRAEEAVKLMPVKLEILRTVSKFTRDDVRFDQLPERVQKVLTQFLIDSIDRAKEDLRTRMAKRESLAYRTYSLAAHRAVQELEHVVATKFAEAGELENTSNAKQQDDVEKERRAKAFACVD